MTDRVEIEVSVKYDGGGVDAAKADLASLAGLAGDFGQTAGKMGDQLAASTKVTQDYASSLGMLEGPYRSGLTAIPQISEALGATEVAMLDAGTAVKELGAGSTATFAQLESGSAPMLAISEHAQNMATQISAVNDSVAALPAPFETAVTQIENTSPPVLALSQHASTAAGNLAVFQDALSNPAPFEMIQSHLDATGQSMADFTKSIGEGNAGTLYSMAASAHGVDEGLNQMEAGFQQAGKAANDAFGGTGQLFGTMDAAAGNASKSVGGMSTVMGSMAKEMNAFGGVGSALYGPAKAGMGFGEAFGDAFASINAGLSNIMMPMMALQMGGMIVSQLATGIYSAAAIAEGPAAHSFGSFTGTVDALGQSMAKSSQQFSEGFGTSIMPTLNAMNASMNQGGSGGIGEFLGGLGTTALNLFQLGTGIDIAGGGVQGFANQFAQMAGLPQPFQGPGPESQAQVYKQQQMDQLPQTMQMDAANAQVQASKTMQEAVNPMNLAANNQLTASQQTAAYLQQQYDIQHPISRQQEIQQARSDLYTQQETAAMHGGPLPYTPGSWTAAQGGGGIGSFFGGIGSWFHDLFAGVGSGEPGTGGGAAGGCFPAGTRILLANGDERPIESIKTGERVKSHDGKGQVEAEVTATMAFHHKTVYRLTFSNGTTLRLTDSHPVATIRGWKSLSPAQTAKENPGLIVYVLSVGDQVYTNDSFFLTLLNIEQEPELAQVFNFTVKNIHTYYADGFLVHNVSKAAGGQQDFTHEFHATATWVADGLEHTFEAIASWIGQGLQNTFEGIANWIGQGLENTFEGLASWVGKGLENTFEGIADWVGRGLEKTFEGVADWVGKNLQHTFEGVADWVGQGLQHTFQATASFLGVPGFAAGVENFHGGVALVGEQGPELLMLPSGSSVYPAQTGTGAPAINPIPLASGAGGFGSGPIQIHNHLSINGRELISIIGPDIASELRLALGGRSA